ncbi:MAG TPA: hypothetical protein VGP72_14685 [Planctomycetota bacterium]|jgi:hypothetical protein
MSFPEYGAAIEQVGDWIVTEAKAVAGTTIFLEPSLPPAPDAVCALFENGGDWDESSNAQNWRLHLVTRAATLKEGRALAAKTIKAILAGFKKNPKPVPSGIRNIMVDSLPALQLRDDRGRVIIETRFRMLVSAISEFDS